MDSWYACQKLMAMIDNLGKIYYCHLKKNRLVDDTKGGENYKHIEKVKWTESELKSGKLIKIKNFPADKKVKLFRVTVSTNRTEYVVTNDLSQSEISDVKKVCSERWKIEEFHRELKQLTGIESCQCRKARIQKNPIVCAFLVWSFLKKTARLMGKTIYQLKSELLADYLKKELKYPAIRLTFV
jgi:Transposase DDE domain